MNIKNHIGLISGGVVAGILVAGGIFLLISFHGRYTEVDQELETQMQRYKTLVNRDPFPSHENVELARKNYEQLETYAMELRTSLREGQIEPQALERADFPPLVERTLRGLWKSASDSKVTFPEGFAFGFTQYIEGALPAKQYIPRLVVQLKTVDELCKLLFDAKITELTDLTRQEFDKKAVEEEPEEDDRRGRRRRSSRRGRDNDVKKEDPNAQKGNDLFTIETFKVSFTARESAVWDLLNNLARSELFVVVKSLQFAGDVDKVAPISYAKFQEDKIRNLNPGGRLTPIQMARIERIRDEKVYDPPMKEERVVAGRETVDVEMVCDVYRFRLGETEAEEGQQ